MKRNIQDCKFSKGQQVEHLTVLDVDNSIEYKAADRTYYSCRCVCGKIIRASNAKLTTSLKKHCGCIPVNDFINREFGKVVIIQYAGYDTRYGRKRASWIGRCRVCKKDKCYMEEVLLRGDVTGCGKCKPKGKDSPRHNPLSNRLNKRDSVEYRAWCRAVFKRDRFRCQCCGKCGWINAHHKNGWNWCFTQRFDVKNGVTLCAGKTSCHNKFHGMYGRGNNTEDQFNQFLAIIGLEKK